MEDCFIKTGISKFDDLIPRVRAFLESDILEVDIEGQRIRGYRSPDTPSIWIRDYSDMLRGIRYFESDLKSTVQHFADTQSASGRIFDYFTTNPEKLPCEKENWTKYVRVPVEADVEFRFIKAAYLAWQACGDDEWIFSILPNMEKAIDYVFSHPHRFDKISGLVKRPYTIDTWDFAYTAGKHDWLQFQIDDDTYWGIFHGDNSGYYESLLILEQLYGYFGSTEKAGVFKQRAERLLEKCNEVCWNGRFYTHFVKLNKFEIQGINEEEQLSMSNPMAINRGLTNPDMAASIIEEYKKRRDNKENYFAEWYSIEPPFPGGIFGDEKLKSGAYINGGIFPLAGGELALAALNNGFEAYGIDILGRYYDLIREKGGSWLWYFPDGTPSSAETSTSPEATSTDGWGSTAMLNALVSGLAGIEDKMKLFREVKFSPRWVATEAGSANVRLSYKASGAFFEYQFTLLPDMIEIDINSPGSNIDAHILLPDGKMADEVQMQGKAQEFKVIKVGSSSYVDFNTKVEGFLNIKIMLS